MTRFIGIDAGNSGCKFASFRGEEIVYGFVPNVTGEAISLDFPPAGTDEKLLSVEVLSAEGDYRKPHFVGELARTQLQEYACQDRNRNKVDGDSVNLIIPAVLGLFGNEDIILGVGATLQDYAEQAPELQRKLTKRHDVRYYLGSKAGLIVRPTVAKTYTFAQGAAGLYSMMRNDNGRVKRPEWVEQTILALDFGHGQINVALMDKMQLIKKVCFSVDYGFYRVVSAVQNLLNSKPYYLSATIPQLQAATEKGYFIHRGEKIDLIKVIDEQCARLTDLIYTEVNNRLGTLSPDSIIIMGGGAYTMAPFVGAKFKTKPELATDSLYANARGLLLIAKEKWEKDGQTKQQATIYR